MLPTLDISDFRLNPSSADGRDFSTRLTKTCNDPGFFYLTGHGINGDTHQKLMALANDFFALPLQDRHEIAIKKSPHFRGYTLLGDERTQGQSDWREQLDIGPEEKALVLNPHDPEWLRLRGPNQWPRGLPGLQKAVMDWSTQMGELGLSLFRALAIGLGRELNYFDHKMYPDPYMRIKISRYPGQPQTEERHQGLGLHHDSGLFTFIFQNEVTGLQIERDGEVVDVPGKKGAYIVNLGEMFQAATNGFLKATRHRVVSPPPGEARISIAYFMNPRLDAVFEPVALPAEYEKLATGGQNRDPDDPVHAVFGENTLKIRKRAHPDVVAAHYTR